MHGNMFINFVSSGFEFSIYRHQGFRNIFICKIYEEWKCANIPV